MLLLSRLSKTKKEEVTCRSKTLSEVSRRQHQSSEEEAKKKSFLSKTLIPKLVSQSDLQMPLSIPWREGLEEVSQWFWILRPQTLFFKERRSTVHTQTLVVMLVELHVLLLTALYWGSGGRTTTTKSSSTWKNISSHRERERERGSWRQLLPLLLVVLLSSFRKYREEFVSEEETTLLEIVNDDLNMKMMAKASCM